MSGSALKTWAWVQSLSVRKTNLPLLSLTSRAPFLRTKHCVVVHDLFVLTNPEWFSRKYVATHAPLLRAHIKSAAVRFAVSPSTRDRVRDLFDLDSVVAPNAPGAQFFNDDELDHQVLEGRGLTPGSFLLTVGSIDPRKNYDRLLAAYASLPRQLQQEYRLVVVGGAAKAFAESDLRSFGKVTLTGYVDDATLATLYRSAKAVIFPSLDEGFGLPAVEGLASGARLVVSDIPVFRWICGLNASYFDPLNVESIASALVSAMTSTVPTNTEVENWREAARKFSWEQTAEIVRKGTQSLV
ncbi:glycosyltransferase family 4 protein [Arthrobacter sp. TS-15]|uniref:glycosyltransferase family 4 protein n=1 Tax=Arthrobacter sp. TS-15 TaxID=2510797 RepID=UPI00313D2CA7